MTTSMTVQTSGMPALNGAAPELQARMLEVRDNLESIDTFTLPRAKMTSQGFELLEGEKPLTELEGVIIHTKKTNVFYAKPYNPRETQSPDCFSLDGNTPDKSIRNPVHSTCRGCPKAEFGTNTMGSGKACRNLKPIYMLLGDEAIMPRQITVTPASLKAANQYLMELLERGISYRKVRTKITAYKADPKDTYMKLKFTMAAKLDEQQVKNAEYLKTSWMPVIETQVVMEADLDQTPTEHVKKSNANHTKEF